MTRKKTASAPPWNEETGVLAALSARERLAVLLYDTAGRTGPGESLWDRLADVVLATTPEAPGVQFVCSHCGYVMVPRRALAAEKRRGYKPGAARAAHWGAAVAGRQTPMSPGREG